jgi:tetratricopeptide (TPR) repeat protein
LVKSLPSALQRLALIALLGFVAAWLAWQGFKRQTPSADPAAPTLAYIGASACGQCHQAQYQAWQGSHHALAMQPANPQTVLGDFKDARFDYNGVTSRFFRRDGQFFVNTDGPDGQSRDYAVEYAFGLTPLQQYLIALPDGRKQALSIAWDSRGPAQGGQRWYHLYPQEKIDHADPLHWTGPYQNWNFMCADCHSTQVRHNYDAQAERFDTQWGEINVACEACHGPGSAHRDWARRKADWRAFLKPKEAGNGLAVDLSGRQQPNRPENLARSTALSFREGQELKTCAVCHARRTALTNEFKPEEGFDQHFLPTFLRPELYEADGQIKDEVYEYNSFRQSKMFAKGVTCGDCHEPHALKLRGGLGAVCLQCHEAKRYAAKAHHHHAEDGQVACVDCHMPQKTYMGVDPRRDHSFRVPRPDLSVRLGVPNACQHCHQDKDSAWAATQVQSWLGREPRGFQRYAEAFHALRDTEAGAEAALQAALRDSTTPPLVKGSLLAEAEGFLHAVAQDVQNSLHADSVAERLGALTAIGGLPSSQRWPLAAHLLQAPERNVRVEAARLLLAPDLDEAQKRQMEPALGELKAAAAIYASRPQWRLIAADIEIKQGHPEKAIEEYEKALDIQPVFAQAYANLADTYRALGQEDKVQETLARGLARLPKEAALHYAKGLSHIRLKQTAAGMKALKRASELAPGDRIFAYAYALGLYSQGDKQAAFAFLKQRQDLHPAERNTLYLLAQLAMEENRRALIEPYLPRLSRLALADPEARQLMEWLEAGR